MVQVLALALSLAAQAKPALPAPAAPKATPAALGIVPFATAEGGKRLERSRHKADFFRLANHFEGQQNLAFCGPTSAVIVLNALRADDAKVARPRDESQFPAEYRKNLPPGLDPVFSRYTQRTFFDERLEKVKPKRRFFGDQPKPGEAFSPGIELRELGDVLALHGLDVQIRVAADALTDKTIHDELVANLGREGDYVIVNVRRTELGDRGYGHMSPLAAWDEASDSFLFLDVNPNGHSWTWIPGARLIEAMRTRDVRENRGYLLIREGRGAR